MASSRALAIGCAVALGAVTLVGRAPSATAEPVTFTTRPDVATTAAGAQSVIAADLDGDGDLDLASASGNDDTIAWYENTTGLGSAWAAVDVATTADSASSVIAADLDDDGDLDLVSTSIDDDTIAWYENDGAADPTFVTQPDIAVTADGAVSVAAADLDDDGDLDLASASVFDNTIAWYRNTAGDGSAWSAADIAVSASQARWVTAEDLDGDGDVDLASASSGDATIAWYRNVAGDGSVWAAADIATNALGAQTVVAADVDGDGDPDLASASFDDNTIAWYRNTAGDASAWTASDIATTGDGSISVTAADVDGDGDTDLAGASYNDSTIAWYENVGGDGAAWNATDVATSAQGAWSVTSADIDGDGDVDLASASTDDDTIAWYENPNSAPSSVPGGPYTVTDGQTVQLDGGGSADAQQTSSSLGYEWDLDDDGAYDDSTSMTPTFSSTLHGVVGANTVGLRVTDAGGLTATSVTTVTVTAAPTGGGGRATTTTTSAATPSRSVTQEGGEDRYATAAGLTDDLAPGIDVAYVATGERFPDALAVGPVAGIEETALLLVERDGLPLATATALTRLRPERIVIIGGVDAVSGSTADALAAFASSGVSRVGGEDRYGTALAIARGAFPSGAPIVYLVSGERYSDAAAAGPAAGLAGGPVLLVHGAGLGDALAAELVRLGPERVVIGGGSAAVDASIDDEVATLLPAATVVRAAGADRYATSIALAQHAADRSTEVVYVATGVHFADALAATPSAIRHRAPIVLVPAEGRVPASVLAFFAARPGVDVVIIGGTAAVSEDVIDQLR